ncbi:TonB-dependent receptor [Apibacter raozihei]|uniref:TonB-dependent receptor n=1 Tax=Apibacter raozihei TaxID=2500547 RepID=UPI000FE314A0|nr:TonB-dependent receptor [Apibacter raozihei]
MKIFLPLLFILVISSYLHSQTGRVEGIVSSEQKLLSNVFVWIKDTDFSTKTDKHGYYKIDLPSGNYILQFMDKDYEDSEISLTIKKGEIKKIETQLKPVKYKEIDNITIKGKSALQKIKESAFSVTVLDAKSFYNSSLDLAHLLEKAPGVKIRESGGLGSDVSVSLNGFTGRHVKIFMDGVPMQGFGSAFQLNNIPVNIAERIEIYKGVVPVEFGTDAIGGVVNIVTANKSSTYLDLSYSSGSFNTYKTNVNLGYTSASGFTFQLNAFQNYSDNNYKVKTSVLDLDTNVFSSEKYWVKRFHGKYHNETAIVKLGVVNKQWADRFLIGVTLGQEFADIQNANLMEIVYGMKKREATTIMPSLSYEKKNFVIKNLNFRLTANYNKNYNKNIDTVARQYNWLGNYIPKKTKGEGIYSLARFYNQNVSATANLQYKISDWHSFTVNNVISAYERKQSDRVAIIETGSVQDTMRRTNIKNIIGGSYKFNYKNKWNADIFGKYYYQKVKGPKNISTVTNSTKYIETIEKFNTTGYGIAFTWFLKDYQWKGSIEKAYRLPTDNELFGDEVLETGNTILKAENSMNYNIGLTYNKEFSSKNTLYVDLTAYYRDTHDYIRRIIEQQYGTASYVNHGKVTNVGIDAELKFYFQNKFMMGANVTYQDIRNKERYSSTSGNRKDITYNDRIPNVPYFFGNADVAYYINNIGNKGNILSIGYTFNFIGKFYLNWESLGVKNSKYTLPGQLSHDFMINYSFLNGKFNASLELKNLTNEFLYDNYSLQKPGRAYYLKLRYFLYKSNKNN